MKRPPVDGDRTRCGGKGSITGALSARAPEDLRSTAGAARATNGESRRPSLFEAGNDERKTAVQGLAYQPRPGNSLLARRTVESVQLGGGQPHLDERIEGLRFANRFMVHVVVY